MSRPLVRSPLTELKLFFRRPSRHSSRCAFPAPAAVRLWLDLRNRPGIGGLPGAMDRSVSQDTSA